MSSDLLPLIRGARSLSLMLTGYDHDLDNKLSRLRNVLKENDFSVREFQSILSLVENSYDSIELMTENGIKNYKAIFSSILKEDRQSLLRPINQDKPTIIDLMQIAEPLAKELTIISSLADDPSASDQSTSPSTNSASESANTNASTNYGNGEAELISRVRTSLTKHLKSVLEALYSVDKKEQTKALKERLNKTPEWTELNSITSETIEIIQNRLIEEKHKFEGYLAKVNQKLNRITQIVESDSSTLSDLKSINQYFNRSLNQQMKEARQKIDEKHTVDTLKTELLDSLDNIASRLEEYQTSYDSKITSLQESKVQMVDQVSQLEQENQSLMSELERERKISKNDHLTQLPNRQGFSDKLKQELSRAERYGHTMSIAILDIDFFKKINDEFGHLVGDKVLKVIAKEMTKVCRETDYLARYGGEEFILLLPETSLKDAFAAVEKIRVHIERCPFHFQSKPVPITISAGVAERTSQETNEAWLQRADEKLYNSKKQGRNRVSG
ncbi:GGDEF domain-containing protein [Reinekea thalattae]|uniref:diguanylate cyclase n=1 Tax=Reinekea thalattae TaxID=2593301 RepID=A0A5C8ZD00_9GAMM|nr:diguanylate cyclase [Reinekea thalattae]TXR54730.1 diguanylate cyclase [Reinekea thalattae]